MREKLEGKLRLALDEGRMLVLGAQVLVGFQYRAAFEPRFARLGGASRELVLIGLCLMLAALALLLAPAGRHQLVCGGRATSGMLRFVTRCLDAALAPFALGLAGTLYVAFDATTGSPGAALVAGLAGGAVAVGAWYGILLVGRRGRAPWEDAMRSKTSWETPLGDRIVHVMIEVRTVLPGAQALLGFQFVTILMDGFETLPASSKLVHLASLSAIALAIVACMLPAAFHRLVERGEDTEAVHAVASASVIAAMIGLALGTAGDLFVVGRLVTGSLATALALTGALLAIYGGLWFGWPLALRARRSRESDAPEGEAPGRAVTA